MEGLARPILIIDSYSERRERKMTMRVINGCTHPSAMFLLFSAIYTPIPRV